MQRNLYRAARTNPERCFHSLYDKVYRSDVLWEAWKRVKANGGVPGNDGETIEEIIARGEAEYLKELQKELKEKRYRAKSIRRVYIPKPDGRLRPLGMPRVRCRIVQGAAKIVLEPILEAHFHESSYGCRPKRSTKDASIRIRKYMNFGYNLPIEWIVSKVNPILLGWTQYYRHTNSSRVFKMLQSYTNDRIRKAIRYRCKKKGIGRYRDLSNSILYSRYGSACIGMGRIEYCWS